MLRTIIEPIELLILMYACIKLYLNKLIAPFFRFILTIRDFVYYYYIQDLSAQRHISSSTLDVLFRFFSRYTSLESSLTLPSSSRCMHDRMPAIVQPQRVSTELFFHMEP